MAARGLGFMLGRSSKILFRSMQFQKHSTKRFITTNESGGVLEKPEQVKLGLIKLAAVAIPFTYVGAMISREFAAWLEEHELFVPDDDDDDD